MSISDGYLFMNIQVSSPTMNRSNTKLWIHTYLYLYSISTPLESLSPMFRSRETLFDGVHKHRIFQSGGYPFFIIELFVDWRQRWLTQNFAGIRRGKLTCVLTLMWSGFQENVNLKTVGKTSEESNTNGQAWIVCSRYWALRSKNNYL